MIRNYISILLSLCLLWADFPSDIGKNGAVSTSSEYATDIGLNVLKDGGNAIDAAVAIGFALSVAFPNAGNLGGGGFMVIRFSDGEVTTIDFREVAPEFAYRDMFLNESGEVIQGKSWSTAFAAGVPGTVAGLGYAHHKYGSKSWSSLVYPSINLARDGFKLTYRDAMYLNQKHDFLLRDAEASKIFASKERYSIDDIFIQTDLAKTLNRISHLGYHEFYIGKTAELITKCMRRTGGIITATDLLNYNAVERRPIEFDYKDYTIYSMPPPSSGGICLAEILNQIEKMDIGESGYHSVSHIQSMVEAEKRAYSDRAEYMGDTDFVKVPVKTLISDKYAQDRISDYDPDNILPSSEIKPGLEASQAESDETTHYSVVDKWGNAVSVTTTLNGKYGNGIVVDGAGFLLNNEMDDFSIKPGYPNKYGLVGKEANAIEPKKRMLSSMSPSIVENPTGDLYLVLGTPGGSTIITTIAQILVNIIDFGMNIEDAVQSPRFHHQWLPDVIFYEKNGFSLETLDALNQIGYSVYEKQSIGEANCIQITSDDIKFSTSDARRGASAKAY